METCGRIWQRKRLARAHHQPTTTPNQHKFGLTLVDLHHSVRFVSYDRMYDEIVDSANTWLSDIKQSFYDMSYVSKRAIGLRLREAERKGQVVQTALDPTWEAVVGLSEAASVRTLNIGMRYNPALQGLQNRYY
eukprot:scaffold5506_cov159-Amphora_coffeaeformis.AAC.6